MFKIIKNKISLHLIVFERVLFLLFVSSLRKTLFQTEKLNAEVLDVRVMNRKL